MSPASAVERTEKDALRVLRIRQSRALSYRFSRDGSSRRYVNYVVELRGAVVGQDEVVSLGEGQPRGRRTGDDAGRSWPFLEDAVAQLHGREIPVHSAEAAISAVRRIMREFESLAIKYLREPGHQRPFRGTLLGIEASLLDLVAKAQGVTLAALLGQQGRQRVPLSAPLISPREKPKSFRAKLKKQFREYAYIRLGLPADPTRAAAFLDQYAKVREKRVAWQQDKPLWLELNGAYDWDAAKSLIRELVGGIEEQVLPARIIVEQPLPSGSGQDLAPLQLEARECLTAANSAHADIRIMGDESVPDEESFEELITLGPLSAVNIRPAHTGGLLAASDLANAVLRADPEAVVVLSRMPGASRISTAALKHLALAFPKIDGVLLAPAVEKSIQVTERILADEEIMNQREAQGRATLKASPEEMEEIAEADRKFSRQQTLEANEQELVDDESTTNAEWGDDDSYDDPAPASAQETLRDSPSDEEDSSFEIDEVAKRSGQVESHRSIGVEDVPGLGIRLLYTDLINSTLDFATTPGPPPLTFEGKKANTYDDVDFIRPIGSYAVHGHIVEREALAHGLNTQRFHKRKFLVSDGVKYPLAFQTSRWPLSSVTAAAIARHKEAVRIRLGRFGSPVPQGRTFSAGDIDTAVEYAERVGFPVVLKPAEGSMGIGVTANIQSADELRQAFDLLQQSRLAGTEFIVEQHIHGNDYRIMVVGDEVIAAVQRLPAFVVGDGQSTVAELILQKNAIKRRNPHLGPLKMKWNPSTKYALAQRGYTVSSVIPEGESIFLANANNLSQGGDSIDVLDEMHPSILQASVEAVKAIPGLAYCGVDFLLADHRKPIDEQEAAICELNAQASVPVGEYPMFGTPRNMAERFLMECVNKFELASRDRMDFLNLRMVVRGKVTNTGYRKWFARRANEFGCSGSIRNASEREVHVLVSGPTAAVTALAAAAILGPRKAIPTSVVTTHVDQQMQGPFVIETTGE